MKSRKPTPDADREILESLAVCPACGREVQLGPDGKPLAHQGCEGKKGEDRNATAGHVE